jgi:hypothetical protein
MDLAGWMLQIERKRSRSEDSPGGMQGAGSDAGDVARTEGSGDKKCRREDEVPDTTERGGARSGAAKTPRRQSRCPHNRQKSKCRDCGGSSICPHDRQKSKCKDCGGSSVCPHNRIRSRCKECGGTSICQHNRMRSRCKECEGSELCIHLRRRHECKECGGGSICAHKRIRSQCKACRGGGICPHQRQRSKCKQCSSSPRLPALPSTSPAHTAASAVDLPALWRAEEVPPTERPDEVRLNIPNTTRHPGGGICSSLMCSCWSEALVDQTSRWWWNATSNSPNKQCP